MAGQLKITGPTFSHHSVAIGFLCVACEVWRVACDVYVSMCACVCHLHGRLAQIERRENSVCACCRA